ncbi:MAG: CoA-binding protein [Chloroflexota bacterium]
MYNLNLSDTYMRSALASAQTIAVVGHSDNPHRTSYQVAQYLRAQGYTVFAVNPTVDTIDGEKSYPTLADIPEPVDIVNVFRRSEFLPAIVDDAIAIGAKTIWTQLEVIDIPARDKALAHNIAVAMDRCIQVDHARLDVERK